jgi:MscS family membrane protein
MIEIPFLNELPRNLRDPVLRIVLALLAILLIWLLRRVVAWIIAKPLSHLLQRYTGPDRMNVMLRLIQGPINLLVIALALTVATNIILPDRAMLEFSTRLTRSVVIVAAALLGVNAVDVFLTSGRVLTGLTGIVIEEQLVPFLRASIKAVIIALAVVIFLQEWNYDITGLVAGLGLAGLAFSLAAQETVSDLFAFSTIVSDRPFEVGEYIVTPDTEGTVVAIGPRSVRIRRIDQAYITLPNSLVAKQYVVNWSRLSRRQINFVLGVTYNTRSEDMRLLLQRLREMLMAHEGIDTESIVVYFTEFGDSALRILIRCYMPIPDWAAFQAEREAINLKIMEIVEDMELSIAFPSRSIYIENASQMWAGQPTAPAKSAPSDDQQRADT